MSLALFRALSDFVYSHQRDNRDNRPKQVSPPQPKDFRPRLAGWFAWFDVRLAVVAVHLKRLNGQMQLFCVSSGEGHPGHFSTFVFQCPTYKTTPFKRETPSQPSIASALRYLVSLSSSRLICPYLTCPQPTYANVPAFRCLIYL